MGDLTHERARAGRFGSCVTGILRGDRTREQNRRDETATGAIWSQNRMTPLRWLWP
jgi:hypothetical protein